MNENTRAVIRSTFEASNKGGIHFGDVIGQLLAVRIGCTAWLAGRDVTCFGRKDKTHIERFL